MKDDVTKPLPCPWCQQSPSGNNFHWSMQSGLTRMFCEHCGAEGPSGGDKENALHWWNRRPNPETQAVATVNANVRCNACERSLVGVSTANAGCDTQCKPHGYDCALYGFRSPVEAVPVSALRELETELRETANRPDADKRYAGHLRKFADRLSAVIRGTKT